MSRRGCADIIYLPMRHDFFYLATITDCLTRQAQAWRQRPHAAHGGQLPAVI